MGSQSLYWTDTPSGGRLAIAARPRGGDWLQDDLVRWNREGIDVIVSLLTPDEAAELDLSAEAEHSAPAGLDYIALPIEDRAAPPSRSEALEVIERICDLLANGRNVLITADRELGGRRPLRRVFSSRRG